ncbi:MAG: membrane dipeptidase [Myxococcota bacterium]
MGGLSYVDHRDDPAAWARALSVSVHACRLLLDTDFVDLHNALDVPMRLYGYAPTRHHGVAHRAPIGTGHTDFPRLREASVTGVVASIVTQPLATARRRLRTTLDRVEAITALVRAQPEDLHLAVDHEGYRRARAANKTTFFLALAGGHAVSADPSVIEGPLGQQLHRIALVHLTRSSLGGTGRFVGHDDGLTEPGRSLLAACGRARIVVDLAHAGPQTFAETLAAHAPDHPVVVSHTGARAVHDHWKNLEDNQIRAIADRGGVVGISYDGRLLAKVRASASRSNLLTHLEHVLRVGGEHTAALGTTYDGLMVPPHDLPDVTHHPALVQDMLDRGWSEDRIRNVFGRNYLRVVEHLRPGAGR